MKMRTKIVWICALIVLITVLACNAGAWSVSRKAVLDGAYRNAYVESADVIISFSAFARSENYELTSADLDEYFKNTEDDYSIVTVRGKVYHNKTVIPAAELISAAKESGKPYEVNSTLKYFLHDVADYKLIVFYSELSAETVIYNIVILNSYYDTLGRLVMMMGAITVTVTLIAMLIMVILLKGAFNPLRALSKTVEDIADGDYNRRAEVKSKDEIGALAEKFNKMAEAVEAHTMELQESENRKTLFMGNLTHELKTPLTAISGYAQTLRTVQLSEEDTQDALTYIYEESKRLDRLSKKMMRLLELDREADIVFERCEIEELFETARQTCSVVAAEKGMIVKIGNCDGYINADRDLMCDVFINLIENAIKASAEGGEVRLYTEGKAMIVEDFGCGIPLKEQEKILEPFYMVDKSRSRRSGGAGLGLALTALILRHHNMTIRVNSEIGRGTKMIICYDSAEK